MFVLYICMFVLDTPHEPSDYNVSVSQQSLGQNNTITLRVV